MEWVNSVLNIVLTAVMGYVIWLLQNHTKSKSTVKEALKVLLREQIEYRYDMFRDCDTLTKEEYHDFEEMCMVYFDLGGNGTGERMYNEIKGKPIKG